MRRSLACILGSLALAASCAAGDVKATKHATAPKPKPLKKPRSELHFPWFHRASKDVWVPPEVETVGVGRTVKNGKLIEPHHETRVVASGHFNTNLPAGPAPEKGPQGPYTPPNFVLPPESQRLSDSERAADGARQQLEQAAIRASNQVAEANVLGPQIAQMVDENAALRSQRDQLQAQVNQAMGAKGNEPPPSANLQAAPPTTRTEAFQAWQQAQLEKQGQQSKPQPSQPRR